MCPLNNNYAPVGAHVNVLKNRPDTRRLLILVEAPGYIIQTSKAISPEATENLVIQSSLRLLVLRLSEALLHLACNLENNTLV